MSENVTLFRSLLQFVLKPGMRFHDLRIAATFCWAVTGLLLSGKISMSHWSVHRRSRANAASKVCQFSRWLHNERVDVWRLYRPLVKDALAEWRGNMYLALDDAQSHDRRHLRRHANLDVQRR